MGGACARGRGGGVRQAVQGGVLDAQVNVLSKVDLVPHHGQLGKHMQGA